MYDFFKFNTCWLLLFYILLIKFQLETCPDLINPNIRRSCCRSGRCRTIHFSHPTGFTFISFACSNGIMRSRLCWSKSSYQRVLVVTTALFEIRITLHFRAYTMIQMAITLWILFVHLPSSRIVKGIWLLFKLICIEPILTDSIRFSGNLSLLVVSASFCLRRPNLFFLSFIQFYFTCIRLQCYSRGTKIAAIVFIVLQVTVKLEFSQSRISLYMNFCFQRQFFPELLVGLQRLLLLLPSNFKCFTFCKRGCLTNGKIVPRPLPFASVIVQACFCDVFRVSFGDVSSSKIPWL